MARVLDESVGRERSGRVIVKMRRRVRIMKKRGDDNTKGSKRKVWGVVEVE